MKKNFMFVSVLLCLIFTMALPAGAADEVACETSEIVCETSTITYVDGDFEIEETLTVYSAARSNSKPASKSQSIKHNGVVVADVTFNATFGYDGSSAWVISASGSHTTYDGWSYSGERISKSGGTATLTATVSKLGYRNIPVSISMTCSPSGSIS